MVQKKTDSASEGAPPPGGDEALHEDYAEHLARVTPDADRNKALLQARYRALHADDPEKTENN